MRNKPDERGAKNSEEGGVFLSTDTVYLFQYSSITGKVGGFEETILQLIKQDMRQAGEN